MLAVLEGCDGTGKTVLANKIIGTFPEFKYLKPVPSKGPEGQTGRYMFAWMLTQFKEVKAGKSFVMDRINLISEEVYGPICRGRSMLDDCAGLCTSTISRFLALNPIIVYCKPPTGAILKNLEGEALQMAGVREKALKLVKRYDQIIDSWEKGGVEIYRYDYTEDPTGSGPINYIRSKFQEAPEFRRIQGLMTERKAVETL